MISRFTDTTALAEREKVRVETVKADLSAEYLRRKTVAQWGIFDMKGNVVELFPFKDKAAAEVRLAEINGALRFKDETHYLSIVKGN